MYRLALVWLFLHLASADIKTSLSSHSVDLFKVKCDALPFRSVIFGRTCYFVIIGEAGKSQCSRAMSGAQFAQPSGVPEIVWEALFVQKDSFSSDSAGSGKVMCVYESPITPSSTVPQTGKEGGKAICFRQQITVAKEAIDKPEVIDEYHCKMICAEQNECLSYIYASQQCSLFGAKTAAVNKLTMCGTSGHLSCEWTKKIILADCPDDIPRPSIDFYGYAPNPAILAGGGTQINPKNILFNYPKACITTAIMDAMLPDNSHRVEGSTYGGIRWDAKLGSWMLERHTIFTDVFASYYIRSARCYDVNPQRFKDTKSCDSLPLQAINSTGESAGFKFSSVVNRFGVPNACVYPDVLILTVNYFHYNMIVNYTNTFVTCIGGTWILHHPHPFTANMLAGFDPSASAKRCANVLPGARFAQPFDVPEKVWPSLFFEKDSFSIDGDSAGSGKVMCVYESVIQPETAETVAPQNLNGGKAICFRKQIAVAKEPIDRPKAIDEYHCKIICAERNECLSFIFANRQCSLFGNANSEKKSAVSLSACGASRSSGFLGCEWAKKTVISDCPDDIPQPSIDLFGYVPYPALIAGGATPISTNNFSFNSRRACQHNAVVHVTLPDNRHRVQGSYNGAINWVAKLGAWLFKMTPDDGTKELITTYYIRSARCYVVVPSRFADTRTCGGILPEHRINATGGNNEFKGLGPVRKYGVVDFCKTQFIFKADFRASEMNYPAYNLIVYCINGTWMFHYGWPIRPSEPWTARILTGVCAEWKDARKNGK